MSPLLFFFLPWKDDIFWVGSENNKERERERKRAREREREKNIVYPVIEALRLLVMGS